MLCLDVQTGPENVRVWDFIGFQQTHGGERYGRVPLRARVGELRTIPEFVAATLLMVSFS